MHLVIIRRRLQCKFIRNKFEERKKPQKNVIQETKTLIILKVYKKRRASKH